MGGAELAARFKEPPAEAHADDTTGWQAWNGDFYTVKPTAVGWPPWEDYNIEGLRDREHAVEKRPTAWRIACLGDGVTMGRGIRPQQAWPQMLEDLAAAAGRDLDVMNVALDGWSIRQELIAYRRIVRRYRPDQVLLGICLNDVERGGDLSRPSQLVAALYRRSALVRRLVNARGGEARTVEELFTSPGARRVQERYDRTFTALRLLRDEVRADGGRFAILVFPFRFQVEPGAPPPLAQQAIGRFCAREAIPLLDLLPEVAPLGESAFIDDDHLSPAGTRLTAQRVLDLQLVPEEAGTPWRADLKALPASAAHTEKPGRDPMPLLAALRDPSEAKRAAAARALATLGELGATAVPALVACLDDRSHLVRTAAAWALGDIGSAAAPGVLRLARLLGDPDPLVRAGAAYALGGIGTAAKGAVLPIVERLNDADERVRWSAADALGRIGAGVASVAPLAAVVGHSESPGRGLAAEALGRLGPDARPAVPELIAAASDRRADVRCQVVWALGRIGPAALPALPVLRGALADPQLRWRAAEALGRIGPRAVEAEPDLAALLQDSSSSVRWRAASALGAIGSRQAASALAGAVGDPADDVRLAAVTALVEIGAEPPLAGPVFLAALHDTDSRVRLHAVRGLGHLGYFSRDARRGLERASRDADEAVRAQAVRVLRRTTER